MVFGLSTKQLYKNRGARKILSQHTGREKSGDGAKVRNFSAKEGNTSECSECIQRKNSGGTRRKIGGKSFASVNLRR